MALAADGKVYAFGNNQIGALGDSTTIAKNTPVLVLKGAYSGATYLGDHPSNPITHIFSGIYHSHAIAADGILYSFGNNTNGQMGDGSTTNRLVPIKTLKGAYPGTTF
ncbi:MAG: hypothetical protein IPK03_09825 [Bacteroidetes bacterium]|nr:hypothetical protein [Bacteroidota bacterium]